MDEHEYDQTMLDSELLARLMTGQSLVAYMDPEPDDPMDASVTYGHFLEVAGGGEGYVTVRHSAPPGIVEIALPTGLGSDTLAWCGWARRIITAWVGSVHITQGLPLGDGYDDCLVDLLRKTYDLSLLPGDPTNHAGSIRGYGS